MENGESVIEADVLGSEFLSLARTYCIDSPASTFTLTQELGHKRLSCFNGAVRVYLPDLMITSSPYDHPLMLPRRLALPSERYKLAQWLAVLTTQRFVENPHLPEIRDKRAVAYERRHRLLRDELIRRRAAARDETAYEAIAEMAFKEIDKLTAENEELGAEVADMKARLRWSAKQIARLRYHASTVADAEEVGVPVPAFDPATVAEAVQYAAQVYDEQLFFLPKAFETAQDSQYRHPSEVLRVLDGLADVAATMATGTLGMSICDALRERNIDYRSAISDTTSKRLRQQFKFRHGNRQYRCEEHICLGGTYDPVDCLRIYFTTKQMIDGKIVIAHVGRHLNVMTTT
jgi:hypothetical protein